MTAPVTVIDASADNIPSAVAPPGSFRVFWRSFAENKGAVAGLAVIICIAVVAILADLLAAHSPIAQFRDARLTPPVWTGKGDAAFLLGTDDIGRDIYSRLIHGARLSLIIGLIVVTISLFLGMLLGLAAAFFRGAVGILIMRLMDIMLALPSLLLAIVIVAILGPGLLNAMLAVSITVVPHYARLTRAAALSELSREYVTAARVAGAARSAIEVALYLVAVSFVTTTASLSSALDFSSTVRVGGNAFCSAP